MTIPISTEKVLRTTLRALKAGGFLASDADVSIIEQIPNNASDLDITAAVNSISFGGLVSGGGYLSPDEDVNIYIDANDDDSSATTVRYFRVAQDQGSGQVTDPSRELFTIGVESDLAFPPKDYTVGVVGPQKTLGGGNAALKIGNDGSDYYLELFGSYDSFSGNPGARIQADGLDVRATSIIVGYPYSNNIVGGWRDITSTTTTAKFVVGDDSSNNGLFLEQYDSGGTAHYGVVRLATASGTPRLYVYGDDSANNDPAFLLLGVNPSDPFYYDPGVYDHSAVAILGQDNAAAASYPVCYIRDRSASRLTGSTIFKIHTEASTSGWYAMRVFYNAAAVFNIDSYGNVNIGTGASYNATGADVAETVTTDDDYAPGTVLVIRNGIYTASNCVGAKGVAGIVATAPGVVLGGHKIYDESEKKLITTPTRGTVRDILVDEELECGSYVLTGNTYAEILHVVSTDDSFKIRLSEEIVIDDDSEIYAGIKKKEHTAALAVTGIVPTKCSTLNGNIKGNGELLMAGPDGCAVLAVGYYDLSSVVGKAIGSLVSEDGSEKIDMLEVQLV